MKHVCAMLAVAGVLWMVQPAAAQQGPPFMGGGTAFDPEPGIVESGALLDATATVSADRKYVTITARGTNTRLQDLRQFAVQSLGFVGGANPGGGGAGGGGGGGTTGGGRGAGGGGARGAGAGTASGANANGINTSPTAIANQNSVLNREGMFLLVPLE